MCIMPYSSELMVAYATRIPSRRAYPLLVSSLCHLAISFIDNTMSEGNI